jgi:hypothetical protein
MDRQPGAGQSFAEIARREGKAERHIRHLAPLAFPREARFRFGDTGWVSLLPS